MQGSSVSAKSHADDVSGTRHMHAWFILVGILALHVVDEAATDFLGFYNPLIRSIRSHVPWFPMPTFTFGVWLGGLATLVVILSLAGPAVRRGARGTRSGSYMLSALMLLNGLGHLVGSVYFQRWLPGATSAPLLLAGSILLAQRTMARGRSHAA
jgi:hypothetical protein